MARAVADTLEARGWLVAEAGTGTGKTFAYLIPALLSGRRVIVSTGTRTLQDQLFHRDLPLLGRALGRPATVALLKGRANYLCRERWLRLPRELPFEGGARTLGATVARWAETTRKETWRSCRSSRTARRAWRGSSRGSAGSASSGAPAPRWSSSSTPTSRRPRATSTSRC